jgi:hypothetical protein
VTIQKNLATREIVGKIAAIVGRTAQGSASPCAASQSRDTLESALEKYQRKKLYQYHQTLPEALEG